LVKHLEGDILRSQFLVNGDEMRDASCKSVELGDDKSVALSRILKRGCELRPLGYRGDLFRENLLTAGRLERPDLSLETAS